TVTCTRSTVIAAGGSSSFNLIVRPTSAAASSVTNTVAVSTQGETNTANNSATDPTTIIPLPAPDLSITKQHWGDFWVGSNDTYWIEVRNAAGSGPTSAPVVVTDTLPAGLSFIRKGSGGGWTCTASGQTI